MVIGMAPARGVVLGAFNLVDILPSALTQPVGLHTPLRK